MLRCVLANLVFMSSVALLWFPPMEHTGMVDAMMRQAQTSMATMQGHAQVLAGRLAEAGPWGPSAMSAWAPDVSAWRESVAGSLVSAMPAWTSAVANPLAALKPALWPFGASTDNGSSMAGGGGSASWIAEAASSLHSRMWSSVAGYLDAYTWEPAGDSK